MREMETELAALRTDLMTIMRRDEPEWTEQFAHAIALDKSHRYAEDLQIRQQIERSLLAIISQDIEDRCLDIAETTLRKLGWISASLQQDGLLLSKATRPEGGSPLRLALPTGPDGAPIDDGKPYALEVVSEAIKKETQYEILFAVKDFNADYGRSLQHLERIAYPMPLADEHRRRAEALSVPCALDAPPLPILVDPTRDALEAAAAAVAADDRATATAMAAAEAEAASDAAERRVIRVTSSRPIVEGARLPSSVGALEGAKTRLMHAARQAAAATTQHACRQSC
jgi:hypothetical protein